MDVPLGENMGFSILPKDKTAPLPIGGLPPFAFEVVLLKLSASFTLLFDGAALQLRYYCTAGILLNAVVAQLPKCTRGQQLVYTVEALLQFIIHLSLSCFKSLNTMIQSALKFPWQSVIARFSLLVKVLLFSNTEGDVFMLIKCAQMCHCGNVIVCARVGGSCTLAGADETAIFSQSVLRCSKPLQSYAAYAGYKAYKAMKRRRNFMYTLYLYGCVTPSFTSGVSKLRPGGQMCPVVHF